MTLEKKILETMELEKVKAMHSSPSTETISKPIERKLSYKEVLMPQLAKHVDSDSKVGKTVEQKKQVSSQ